MTSSIRYLSAIKHMPVGFNQRFIKITNEHLLGYFDGIVQELLEHFVEPALSSILERDSASTVSCVPKEILTDIFKRLPIKSLLQFSVDTDLHMNCYTIYLDNESFVEYRSIHSPLEIQGCDDYLEIAASLTGKHKAVLGFGFDSKTNDYKVVRLAYRQDSDDSMSISVILQVELSELSMNAWRRINSNAPSCQIFVPSSHAFLHGAVHWVGFGYNADEEWVASVVLFDLENELFRQMKLPDESDTYLRDEFLTTLMVSNQSLCFIDYKTCIHYNMHHIWVMKEYGMAESWTKQFSVHANVNAFPKVLGFRKNGQVLLEEDRGEVVSHDPKTGITTPLGIHCVSEYFCVNSYVESLALLELNDAVDEEGQMIFNKGVRVQRECMKSFGSMALASGSGWVINHNKR